MTKTREKSRQLKKKKNKNWIWWGGLQGASFIPGGKAEMEGALRQIKREVSGKQEE